MTLEDLHQQWRKAVNVATDGRVGNFSASYYRGLDADEFVIASQPIVDRLGIEYARDNVPGRFIKAHRAALIYCQACREGISAAILLKLSMSNAKSQ